MVLECCHLTLRCIDYMPGRLQTMLFSAYLPFLKGLTGLLTKNPSMIGLVVVRTKKGASK